MLLQKCERANFYFFSFFLNWRVYLNADSLYYSLDLRVLLCHIRLLVPQLIESYFLRHEGVDASFVFC